MNVNGRRLGESMHIGDSTIVTVRTIVRGRVLLDVRVNDQPFSQHWLGRWEAVEIQPGITVTATKVGGTQVRLGIDAPPELRIRRSEVVAREAQNAPTATAAARSEARSS